MAASLLLAAAVPAAPWTSSTLSFYHRLRAGRSGAAPATWHGTGTLHGTLSGDFIASVESFERAHSLADTEGQGLSLLSDRVLVYRHANGSLLTSAGRRTVTPLRYRHRVRMMVVDGGVELRAEDGVGAEVATGVADADVETVGFLSRALRLRVAVAPRRSQRQRLQRRGTPGKVGVGGGGTREEYHLIERCWPWLPPQLVYRRTGRCPSWCGSGVCTLELRSERSRGSRHRWEQASEWERRLRALEEEIASSRVEQTAGRPWYAFWPECEEPTS